MTVGVVLDRLKYGSELDMVAEALLKNCIDKSITTFQYIRKSRFDIFGGMRVVVVAIISKDTSYIVLLCVKHGIDRQRSREMRGS